MDNKDIVSVIIPAYNLEKVINKCIHSVMRQTYDEIEIIIVNDGSIDNTLVTIEALAAQDNRIQILNQKNQGLEAARKNGFDIAIGKWVLYVDGDDWLPFDSIEKLLNAAVKNEADVIIGRMMKVLDGRGWIKRPASYPLANQRNLFNHLVFNRDEFMNSLYISYFGVNILPVSIAGSFYRKSLIDKSHIKYSGIFYGEDLSFNMQCLPNANRVGTIPDFIYYYRFGGLTSKITSKMMDDAIILYRLKKEMIEKYGYEKFRPYIAIELKNCLITYIKRIINNKTKSKEEIISIIKHEMERPEIREAVFIPVEADFYDHDNFIKDQFVICIQKKDAEKLYSIIEHNYDKERIRNRLLYLASKILK